MSIQTLDNVVLASPLLHPDGMQDSTWWEDDVDKDVSANWRT